MDNSKEFIEAMILREKAVSDIRKMAELVERLNLDRIARRYGKTPEADEAFKNCKLSAAAILIDRWGVGMDKEICSALKLDRAEMHEYLTNCEVEAAAAAGLEDE